MTISSELVDRAPKPANGALPDIQNSADVRRIALAKVGVRGVRMPLSFVEAGREPQRVHAEASITVGLEEERRGANMSRFIEQMAEWSRRHTLSWDLEPFLAETQRRLESESAHLALSFRYYLEKAAPITGIEAPMGYNVRLQGALEGRGAAKRYEVRLHLEFEASNCCPCSKAIADYGAHNQRIHIGLDATLDTEQDLGVFCLEKLISDLEESASCAAYPVLKRPDEKYVTERQYENPKFVEDVARDAAQLLRGYPGIRGFSFEVEALESIHGHNAWALYRDGDSPV